MQVNEILSLDEFKKRLNEKKKDQTYSYGCIMGYFDEPFKDIKIDKSDLYNNEENEYGLENENHVTILYGLLVDKVKEQDVINLFKLIDGPVVRTSQISLFENKDYDVVKFDVESDDLNLLNKVCTSMFPYESDYPDYHAHATIAYCLPGTGKNYKQKFKKPLELKIAYWVYSLPNGRKIKITPGSDKIKVLREGK